MYSNRSTPDSNHRVGFSSSRTVIKKKFPLRAGTHLTLLLTRLATTVDLQKVSWLTLKPRSIINIRFSKNQSFEIKLKSKHDIIFFFLFYF